MNTSTTFFSLALGKAVSLRSKHSCLLTSTVSYIMTWSYLEPWHSSARSSSKPASVSAAGSGCSGGSSLFPIRDSEFSGKITKNYEFGVSSWFYFSAEIENKSCCIYYGLGQQLSGSNKTNYVKTKQMNHTLTTQYPSARNRVTQMTHVWCFHCLNSN